MTSATLAAVLVTILTTAEIVYVVVLSSWILLEKRPPVATLAWILALIALPYVGFVIFFFLGPRRFVRKRLRHRRARQGGEALRGIVPPLSAVETDGDARVAQLDKLVIGAGEPGLDRCEELKVFHDAASTYDAIETAIGQAQHHVHVAYYIFDGGRAGRRFCDALAARARAGVQVRLLVDGVGSSALGRRTIAELREAGVRVAKFHEVRFSPLRRRIDFRNHRKIVVCDGRVGFTGGINICDDYLPEPPTPDRPTRTRIRHGHPAPWRDSHLRLQGDAVRWLQLTFLDDWHYTTRYLARGPEYFPAASGRGPHTLHVVSSGPDRNFEPIQKLYFAAIASARQRVFLTTPYFVPDDAILAALTTAALRGIDVRILVPRRSDSLVVTAAARSYYDGILATGGRVFEYQPTMIHAKTLVIDDYFAAVGTANMDNRSFRLNFEITAVLYGAAHAAELAGQFERDLEQSREIKAHMRERLPLRWRVAEAGARVLSPLL